MKSKGRGMTITNEYHLPSVITMSLGKWSSQCSSFMNSISITWKFVESTNSLRPEILGVECSSLC